MIESQILDETIVQHFKRELVIKIYTIGDQKNIFISCPSVAKLLTVQCHYSSFF